MPPATNATMRNLNLDPKRQKLTASYVQAAIHSDEEMSDAGDDLEVVPKRDKSSTSYSAAKDADEDDDCAVNGADGEEDGSDEDGDGGEDEYVVEKILNHRLEDGELRFEVKWEGFEKKSDRTWEPEGNLRGTADEALNEYLDKNGGSIEAMYQATATATKGKKRARQSAAGTPATTKKSRKNGDHPLDSDTPQSAKLAAWKPPAGSWENEIDTVDMTRNEQGDLIVWLGWRNGEKSQHKAQQAYNRAPQKMLKFYESKINFTSS